MEEIMREVNGKKEKREASRLNPGGDPSTGAVVDEIVFRYEG